MSNPRPPKTVAEWVAYLHAARAVPKDSRDYGDAQEAVRYALQRIRTLNVAANTQEQGTAERGKSIGPAAAVGAGLMNSVRVGEPIAGLLSALIPGGQGFTEGAQQYRQGWENIGNQQPTAASVGDVGGQVLQALAPVGQAIKGGTATAARIPSTRANALARFFTGAGQTDVAPALTLGAMQGFGTGGEDPGDLNARLQAAAVGGGVGAVGAAALGGLGALRVPRWLSGVKREMRQAVPKGTPPEIVDGMTEAAIRQGLARDGHDAASQSRVIAAWKAGKATVPPPPPPPTVRPGETIAPIDPLASPTYQRSGKPLPEVRPSPMAKGQPGAALPPSWQELNPPIPLQPGGVGGHSYSGTYPASPSPSDIMTFLQSTSPQELLAKLATLHGMGVRELPGAMPDLLQRLLGTP